MPHSRTMPTAEHQLRFALNRFAKRPMHAFSRAQLGDVEITESSVHRLIEVGALDETDASIADQEGFTMDDPEADLGLLVLSAEARGIVKLNGAESLHLRYLDTTLTT